MLSDGLPRAAEVDSTGFVFFTNYTSRKSQELLENPFASLTFYWHETSRQVRVSGRVEKVSRQESEAYFQSRPRGSRMGAWASKQSSVIGETDLEERVEDVGQKFGEEGEVECPKFWGGWRVVPEYVSISPILVSTTQSTDISLVALHVRSEVEFWSGQPSRLHDRCRYLRLDTPASSGAQWKIDRLSP